jgi:hypothetical protein
VEPEPATRELPAAHLVPRARIPAPHSIDHPAFGLVLALIALYALPASVGLLVQLPMLGRSFETWMITLLALMLAAGTTQLIAGIAIAWQWPRRRLWFASWVAACLALVIAALVLWRDELGSRQSAVMFLETMGGPLVAVLGVRWIRPTKGAAVGALLIVMGSSLWLAEPVYLIEYVPSLVGDSSLGSWSGLLLRFGVTLAIATVGLSAGFRMARGQSARRALATAAIVAIAGYAVSGVGNVVSVLVEGHAEVLKYVVPSLALTLVFTIGKWTVVWCYAKRETEPHARVDAALPWLAAWFVPLLLARCLLFQELAELGDVNRVAILGGCAGAAIALIAALRTQRVAWWLAATAMATLLFGFAIYVVHDGALPVGVHAEDVVSPIALLLATTCTAAWFARRLSSR